VPASVSHAVYPSVDQIDPADWSRLFGDVAEGRDFFRTLESSRLEGFGFCYVVVRRGDRAALIAPLFWSDFDLGLAVEGIAQRILRGVRRIFPRLLVARTLFCGSPFGETGTIGVEAADPDRPGLVAELVRAMEEICRERGLGFMLFKDFPAEAAGLLESLAARGFFQGDSFPNVVLPLPYAVMSEYLASLSHNARKDLRRKIKHTLASGPIEVRVVDQVADLIEPVYALYLATYQAGTVRFEKLTREYFLEVGRRMRGEARFFLFYRQGRLVCFNLCFQHGDQLIDKFIGLDYAVARELNLYFYTWHHNVEWCITHGIRHYQVGQTDHAAKVRLGGKLVPLYFHARHTNPWLNVPLKLAARFLAPPAPAAG
jgi:predicted N-acyltransferase